MYKEDDFGNSRQSSNNRQATLETRGSLGQNRGQPHEMGTRRENSNSMYSMMATRGSVGPNEDWPRQNDNVRESSNSNCSNMAIRGSVGTNQDWINYQSLGEYSNHQPSVMIKRNISDERNHNAQNSARNRASQSPGSLIGESQNQEEEQNENMQNQIPFANLDETIKKFENVLCQTTKESFQQAAFIQYLLNGTSKNEKGYHSGFKKLLEGHTIDEANYFMKQLVSKGIFTKKKGRFFRTE